MEQLLHRTADESTYYAPPPEISLLCNTTNNYCSGQLFSCATLRQTLIQPMQTALHQTTFLTQAQALSGKAISEHTTQQNAEVKGIINKDRQAAPKRMPRGAC